MHTPPKIGLPGCRTLFDELQSNHQIQSPIVHWTGSFLPYHRLLMRTHEYFLQTECGYRGAQPYWDEPPDAGNFNQSVLFHPVLGFGGNGRKEDGCIVDGPFAKYVNVLGPGFEIADHCIDRDINEMASKGPHMGGHGGTGREMANPISSPGDPIFYLHHTWLDKLWWDWQVEDLPARLHDITGRNTPDPSFGFLTGSQGSLESVCGSYSNCIDTPAGDPGNTTTLSHVLSTLGLRPNVTIAHVMNIHGEYLCYEYV